MLIPHAVNRRVFALSRYGDLLALLLRQFDARIGFAAWAGLSNPDVYRVSLGELHQPIARLWTLNE